MTKTLVPLHEPTFAGNEWDYVKRCLDTNWVSTAGDFVTKFEQGIARRLGTSDAVAVVNGTSGLHLALRLLGVGRGDEVIMPSLTFIATANSAVYLGAAPRFLDVEERTLGLDPEQVLHFLETGTEKKGGALVAKGTGRRIAACMPMHAFGHPARVDLIAEACARFGVPVVEDAAEALGSLYRGRSVGSFGVMSVVSFNGNKILTTGGGGMLATSDAALARRARHLSTQAKKDPLSYWHDEIGYNYRLPNINAALGCAQLEQLDGFLKRKRAIAESYRAALAKSDGLRLVWEPENARSNFWLNTVRASTPELAKKAAAALNEAGYGCRPFWGPAHRQPVFEGPRPDLPVTDRLWETSFNIPSSTGLDDGAVAEIGAVLARSAR